jgi:hypothetical protein
MACYDVQSMVKVAREQLAEIERDVELMGEAGDVRGADCAVRKVERLLRLAARVADRIGIGEDRGLARHRHFPAGSQ